jgi:hypothetical protein
MSTWLVAGFIVLLIFAAAQWWSLRFWHRQYELERLENSALRTVCVDAGLALKAYRAIQIARGELVP